MIFCKRKIYKGFYFLFFNLNAVNRIGQDK